MLVSCIWPRLDVAIGTNQKLCLPHVAVGNSGVTKLDVVERGALQRDGAENEGDFLGLAMPALRMSPIGERADMTDPRCNVR
jgi:hypothetical protein